MEFPAAPPCGRKNSGGYKWECKLRYWFFPRGNFINAVPQTVRSGCTLQGRRYLTLRSLQKAAAADCPNRTWGQRPKIPPPSLWSDLLINLILFQVILFSAFHAAERRFFVCAEKSACKGNIRAAGRIKYNAVRKRVSQIAIRRTFFDKNVQVNISFVKFL